MDRDSSGVSSVDIGLDAIKAMYKSDVESARGNIGECLWPLWSESVNEIIKSCVTMVKISVEGGVGPAIPGGPKEDSKDGRDFKNRGKHNSRLKTLAKSQSSLQADPEPLVE